MKLYALVVFPLLFLCTFAHAIDNDLKWSHCPALLETGLWSHGLATASVQNDYVLSPFHQRLYEVTTLGGGFGQAVGRARFSENSQWVAAELANGKLALWNVQKRTERIIDVPEHKIYSFDFNKDSTRLMVRFNSKGANACCGKDNGVQLWDLNLMQPVSGHIHARGSHATAHFSADGRWLITDFDRVKKIFDGLTGTDTGLSFEDDMNYATDGDYVLVLGGKGTAKVIRLSTGEQLARRQIIDDRQIFGDLSAKTGIAVFDVIMETGVPVLYDLQTLAPLPVRLQTTGIDPNAQRIGARLSPDGLWVHASMYQDSKGTGYFWDTRTGRIVYQIDRGDTSVTYSSNEKFAAIAVGDRKDALKQSYTSLINRSNLVTTKVPGGHPHFYGNILVTIVNKDSAKTDDKLGYYFTDPISAKTTYLDNQTHELVISADGSRFFYNEHGAIHLFEVSAKAVEVFTRIRR